MKTLDEYNEERNPQKAMTPTVSAYVLCPKCREEMRYSNPNVQLLSLPPRYAVFVLPVITLDTRSHK